MKKKGLWKAVGRPLFHTANKAEQLLLAFEIVLGKGKHARRILLRFGRIKEIQGGQIQMLSRLVQKGRGTDDCLVAVFYNEATNAPEHILYGIGVSKQADLVGSAEKGWRRRQLAVLGERLIEAVGALALRCEKERLGKLSVDACKILNSAFCLDFSIDCST